MTVQLQTERLRRHYEIAVHTYDHVSLLDLSHTLRIWMEMGDDLSNLKRFKSDLGFKTCSPNKQALRLANSSEFVFTYFPEKTITYAHGGKIGEISTDLESCVVGAIAGIDDKGGVFVKGFYFSGFLFEKNQMRFLSSPKTKRVNYKNWVGSEIVRIRHSRLNDGDILAIPRIHLVKRIANAMDGSHHSSSDIEDDNRYDEPIRYLMRIRLGALPLPYFILLNTAQVILAKAYEEN